MWCVVSSEFRTITLTTEFLSESVGCGDFDGDGFPDVVAGPYWYAGPEFRSRHRIFEAPPFDPHGYSASTQPCFVYDVNGDGLPDVFYVMRSPGERGNYGFHGWGEALGWEGVWYENPGAKGGLWHRHTVLSNIANEAIAWGDVNGDGRPEPIYSGRDGYGYATFDPAAPGDPWSFHRVSEPMRLSLSHGIGAGDITGDGRLDIVCADGWWENPGPERLAKPWPWHPFQFARRPADMLVCDVDGDGRNDIVTVWDCHRHGLLWWRQIRRDGIVSWERQDILPPEPAGHTPRISQMHAVALADLNRDGTPGIVTGKRWWAHGPHGDVDADRPPVVYWFEPCRGADGVRFVPHLVDDDSGVGTQVVVADANGDGLPDVLTSNKKGLYLHLRQRG